MKRLALSSLLLISVVAAQAKPRPFVELSSTPVLKPAGSSGISSLTNDTIYFGGTRWAADSMRWEAIKDSVWTFDTGVGSFIKEPGKTYPGVDPYKPDGFHGGMEGWIGWDLTARPVNFFRRLSSADPRWLGSPCVGAAAGLGGNYSCWVGVFPAEAESLCFASGKGYGNVWHVCLEHGFDYFGGAATLAFSYKNETEEGFDYTYVYCDTGGSLPVEIVAYTGTASGTASLPMTQGIELPVVPKPIRIKFCVDSDAAWSDQDGLSPTDCGAFAVDNILLTGAITHSADFETSDDGWKLSAPKPALGGEWSNLVALQDLPPPDTLTQCSFRDSVLVFYDPASGSHPPFQDNVAISPWIDFERAGVEAGPRYFIDLDGYFNLPLRNYIFVATMTQWFPDTCSVSGQVGVSPWNTNGFVYYFGGYPVCRHSRRLTIDFTNIIPPQVKQVRIGVGVVNYCRFFANCTGVENSSPWFDNLRFATYKFHTIQEAIDQAASGDTIWVPPGTYNQLGDVNLTFRGKNVVLRSVAGAESTFIDGKGENRGLICDQGEDSTSAVIGFTFTNCTAPKDPQNHYLLEGGAVYLGSQVSVRFENCVFQNSKAGKGGGLFTVSDARPQFKKCLFKNNDAWAAFSGNYTTSPGEIHFEDCRFDSNSGAVYIDYMNSTFVRCSFEGNQGGTNLGGLSNQGAADLSGYPLIDQCEFKNNLGNGLHLYYRGDVQRSKFTANQGAGLNYGTGYSLPGCGSQVTIRNCVFSENKYQGMFGCGGTFDSCLVERNHGGGFWAANSRIRHSRIRNNDTTHDGGGAYLEGGLLEDCIVSGNKALRGGGVLAYPVSYETVGFNHLDTLEIRGCIITGNTAISGGGLFLGQREFGVPSVQGVTISSNFAAWGGGIYVGATPLSVSRSVIWGNEADSSGAEVFLSDPDSVTTFTCSALDSSGIKGKGQAIYDGPQVFSDPSFCRPALASNAPTTEGDYTLWFRSPCLPLASPCDSLIGALGEGCDVVPVLPPPDPWEPPFLKTPGIHAGPNPFTQTLTIHYLSPIGTDPRLEIFTVDGRRVGSWSLRPGSGVLDWNGTDLLGKPVASGLYLLRYIAGDLQVVRRVVRISR